MADAVTVACVAGGSTVAGVVLGKVFDMITAGRSAKAKEPADLVQAVAVMQKAVADQAEAFTQALLQNNGELRSEVDRLARRVETLEAENVQCRGENAQLHQMIESFEEHLRRAGIDMPPRRTARAFTVMEGGKVTSFTPETPPPPPRRRRRKAAP